MQEQRTTARAMQGGLEGAHVWGVLDQLAERQRQPLRQQPRCLSLWAPARRDGGHVRQLRPDERQHAQVRHQALPPRVPVGDDRQHKSRLH